VKNLKQWTHFTKTFWKMAKVESKVAKKTMLENCKMDVVEMKE
jgi:hypothetical protein